MRTQDGSRGWAHQSHRLACVMATWLAACRDGLCQRSDTPGMLAGSRGAETRSHHRHFVMFEAFRSIRYTTRVSGATAPCRARDSRTIGVFTTRELLPGVYTHTLHIPLLHGMNASLFLKLCFIYQTVVKYDTKFCFWTQSRNSSFHTYLNMSSNKFHLAKGLSHDVLSSKRSFLVRCHQVLWRDVFLLLERKSCLTNMVVVCHLSLWAVISFPTRPVFTPNTDLLSGSLWYLVH